jgi:hypothetical protein
MVRPKERGRITPDHGGEEPDGAENLAEQPRQRHGPVAHGIERGGCVPDAVDPDDHAYALPDLRIIR